MALSDGYSPDNVIIISEIESAIKLSEDERKGLNKMKDLISSDKDISCVYCFALDRLSRTKKVLFSVIDYLVNSKVNLVIKEPQRMSLLNEDYSINEATEMCITLFAQLAESEMRNKQARFKRQKSFNKKQGYFNGGKMKFGYCKNDNKQIIVDEYTSGIVKLVFELYNTENYSYNELCDELKHRGYFGDYSIYTLRKKIQNILHDKTYIGSNDYDVLYPRIISDEVFDKAHSISFNKAHYTYKKQQEHIYYSKGLIYTDKNLPLLCKVSQAVYFAKDKSMYVSINMVDAILLFFAKPLYNVYLTSNMIKAKNEYTHEIILLKDKIEICENNIKEHELSKEDIDDAVYVYKTMTKEKGQIRKDKIDELINIENNNIIKYTERKEALEHLIKDSENDINLIKDIEDDETKYDIVHRVIEKAIITKIRLNVYNIRIKPLLSNDIIEAEFNVIKKTLSFDGVILKAEDFRYKQRFNKRNK